jgi:hypothetical protein
MAKAKEASLPDDDDGENVVRFGTNEFRIEPDKGQVRISVHAPNKPTQHFIGSRKEAKELRQQLRKARKQAKKMSRDPSEVFA